MEGVKNKVSKRNSNNLRFKEESYNKGNKINY